MDLVHAVNTLPSGFLWASKLKSWQVGLIATLSSVLGLYQVFAKKNISWLQFIFNMWHNVGILDIWDNVINRCFYLKAFYVFGLLSV